MFARFNSNQHIPAHHRHRSAHMDWLTSRIVWLTSCMRRKIRGCDSCGLGQSISSIETSLISVQQSAKHGCQRCRLLAESAGIFRNVWLSQDQSGDEAVNMKLDYEWWRKPQYPRVFVQWPSAGTSQRQLIELNIYWEASHAFRALTQPKTVLGTIFVD